MYGSDQAASIEPQGFARLVVTIRAVEKAMGDGKVGIIEKEISIAQKLRAHIPFSESINQVKIPRKV